MIDGAALDAERAAATVWIRVQMARHVLSLADLQAAGCFAVVAPPPGPARTYRNAEGQKPDGQGEMPTWLQGAVNAGQSAEHFLGVVSRYAAPYSTTRYFTT